MNDLVANLELVHIAGERYFPAAAEIYADTATEIGNAPSHSNQAVPADEDEKSLSEAMSQARTVFATAESNLETGGLILRLYCYEIAERDAENRDALLAAYGYDQPPEYSDEDGWT